MNLEDCKTVLSLICMNLDRQMPEGLDQLWAATLADIPAQYGKAAAMHCITSSPFMPKVADIRSRALEMQEADARAAERSRRLALERAKTPAPERRADGAEMVRAVLAAVKAGGPGADLGTKAKIADRAIAEWRANHPDSTAPRAGDPCPNPNCRCTHTDGCEAGWIEVEADNEGRARVMSCPTCNFRRHQILTAGDRREVALHNLRDTGDIKRAA